MKAINLSDINIHEMTPDDDIGYFDCGDEDLNEFIREDALNQMNAKISVTYLCRYKEQVVAFFILSADAIKINLDDLEKFRDKDIHYKDFPALKIGRLGVCNPYQGRNIGTHLILLIIGQAFRLSKKIGIRYVSVDAYKYSVGFYKKKYFAEFIHDRRRKTVPMYLDILKLEKS